MEELHSHVDVGEQLYVLRSWCESAGGAAVGADVSGDREKGVPDKRCCCGDDARAVEDNAATAAAVAAATAAAGLLGAGHAGFAGLYCSWCGAVTSWLPGVVRKMPVAGSGD